MSFSPDGKRIATVAWSTSGYRDHAARVWDVGRRRPLAVELPSLLVDEHDPAAEERHVRAGVEDRELPLEPIGKRDVGIASFEVSPNEVALIKYMRLTCVGPSTAQW